jgi:NAD(P)-dependent dehydrogenase (short-subunit alcohol dehydrogenase family)
MRFTGCHAIVTGAGSGIGQSIALHLAREGALVVAAGRTEDSVALTVQEIEAEGGSAFAAAADMAQPDEIHAMMGLILSRIGHIDILVNNAGKATVDGVLETDVAGWDHDFHVVLRSAFLASKAVLPGMIERNTGAIVNIASVNGLAGLGEEAYSAAKAGMINFTRNLAIRYGRHGVRANCVCPATIRTPIWNDIVEREPNVFERLSKWYPLGRIGEPDDVAKAVAFLASDDAAWITGEVLNVDGGLMAGTYRLSQELMGEA